METFVANTKRLLWDFVEIAFLAVLSLVLLSLLLGTSAGGYVTSVAENVSEFASHARRAEILISAKSNRAALAAARYYLFPLRLSRSAVGSLPVTNRLNDCNL